jgi:GPH family glycoside/pentoside/hexuronide:cation symporter
MAEKLKKSQLYTFGVGDLCFTLLATMELFYFSIFLTDHARFSLIIFSVILGVTGAADIICALVAGVVLQKTSLKKFGGKYRSWLVLGPPIVALLFIFQFSKIGSEYIAAAIIIFGFLASHLLWNVVFASTGALVGTITHDSDERTILSSSRAQGISAASLIFAFTGPVMIFSFFGPRTSEIMGFSITAAIFGIVMILGYLYVYRITAVGDTPENRVTDAEKKETKKTLREIVRLVFKNLPLLWLIIAETFRNTCIFIITSFAAYYFKYVLDNPEFFSSSFIRAISVALLVGTFAAPWIGVRIGKRNAYWITLILSAFAFLSAAFIEANAWSFTVIFCIASMLGMIAGSMSTALFVDTVVYGEWKTGKNIQAFTMSLLVLPIKLGLLIRAGVMSIGFITIGFVANATPTPEVVNGINSIMIYSPAIAAALAAAVFYFGYRIEEKHVLQMQDEIAAR